MDITYIFILFYYKIEVRDIYLFYFMTILSFGLFRRYSTT